MEYRTFEESMKVLALAFDYTLTPPQMAVYWKFVLNTRDDVFREVVNIAIESEKQFPVIATLSGVAMRVNDQWASDEREHRNEQNAVRFISTAETRTIPQCMKCHDLGWYVIESPAANRPSTLERCDCDAAVKGQDRAFEFKQRSAFLFGIDRDKARHPQPVPREGVTTIKDVAHIMDMNAQAARDDVPPLFLEPGPMQMRVPVPIAFRTFRIIRVNDENGRPGFRAKWNLSEREQMGVLGKEDYACPWRRLRDDVRTSMLYLYADVQEFGKEVLPQQESEV